MNRLLFQRSWPRSGLRIILPITGGYAVLKLQELKQDALPYRAKLVEMGNSL